MLTRRDVLTPGGDAAAWASAAPPWVYDDDPWADAGRWRVPMSELHTHAFPDGTRSFIAASTAGVNHVLAVVSGADPDAGTLLRGWDLRTGSPCWTMSHRSGGPACSRTLASDGSTFYATLSNGEVWAIEPETGHVRWAMPLGRRIAGLCVRDGLGYVKADNAIVAIRLEPSGAVAWSRELGAGTLLGTGASVVWTLSYAPDFTPEAIHALAAETGEEVARVRISTLAPRGADIFEFAVHGVSDDDLRCSFEDAFGRSYLGAIDACGEVSCLPAITPGCTAQQRLVADPVRHASTEYRGEYDPALDEHVLVITDLTARITTEIPFGGLIPRWASEDTLLAEDVDTEEIVALDISALNTHLCTEQSHDTSRSTASVT